MSCGDKFTMVIVEPQLLPQRDPPVTLPESSVVASQKYVDICLANDSEALHGNDILLCFLSLMLRAFKSKLHGSEKSPRIATEYSVEISTLCYESLYSLLDIHTNYLFEHSTTEGSSNLTWDIVRTVLQLLNANLEILFNVVEAEFPLPSSMSPECLEPQDSLLRTLEDHVSDGVVQPLHTVSSADRLAAILSATGNDCDARSSDDEEEDEEEEDSEDDEEDEESEDEEEEDEEYDQYTGHIDGDLEDTRGDEDQDDFDVGKSAYADDDDGTEDDMGLNTPGTTQHHGLLSPRQCLSDEKLSPMECPGNNESDSENQFSPSKLDDIYQVNSSLGLSPGVGSDDDVEDLIRVDGHHSPALSNTSVDISHHVLEYDSTTDIPPGPSEQGESLKSGDDDYGHPNQFQLCNDEEDEDLQKAIYSSIDPNGKDDSSVGQALFTRETATTSRDILSVLSGRMEDLSRKYYDEMQRNSGNGDSKHVDRCFEIWKEIQNVIGNGFLIMYPFLDQKELLISILRDPIDILHMVPGISVGLRNDRLVFLIQDLLDSKELSPRTGRGDETQIPTPLSLVDIVLVLQNLRSQKISVAHVCMELILNSTKISQSVLGSLYEILQSVVYFIFMKRLAAVNPEDSLTSATMNEFSSFFGLLLDSVEVEFREITHSLIVATPMTASSSIEIILRTTIISTIFSCVGSVLSNVTYFKLELACLFLPSALRYLSLFQSFSTSCHELPLQICEVVLNWIHSETKWILLFLASLIGVAVRSGSESDLIEDKYRVYTSYQTCCQLFSVPELLIRSPNLASRIPGPLKAWKWIFENNSVFNDYVKSQSSRVEAYPQHWEVLIHNLSVRINDPIRWDNSAVQWLDILANSVYIGIIDSDSNDQVNIFQILQIEEVYLTVLCGQKCDLPFFGRDHYLNEFLESINFLKLCVFALTLTISGAMPQQSAALSSKIVDSWLGMVMIVSSFLKYFQTTLAQDDEIKLEITRNGTSDLITFLTIY